VPLLERVREISRGDPVNEFCYDVLIRTFNSVKTLGVTLASLEGQTRLASKYIFVDSGSTDGTLVSLPANSTVHNYTGTVFNYSASLNQGLDYLEAEYALIISSHTALLNPGAMQFAINLLASDDSIGAAYFFGDADVPTIELITNREFTGFNGVFNTCGVYRTSLLRKRKFREDVPSAEDQEWSRWLLDNEGLSIARISGGKLQINNPKGYSRSRRFSDHCSVALYAKPELRRLRYIARVCGKVIQLYPRQPPSERIFNLKFLVFLLRNIDRKHWR
jgi:glycosyltransferase involved in cell wall biosynthesis